MNGDWGREKSSGDSVFNQPMNLRSAVSGKMPLPREPHPGEPDFIDSCSIPIVYDPCYFFESVLLVAENPDHPLRKLTRG
jgi:hypothetical protein